VESLENAFLEWKENPFRVMGYFPRSHAPGVNPGTLEYVFRPKQQYSMVLTKLMFIHAEYLKYYYGVVNLKSEGMSLNSIILFKCKIRYINQTTVCVQRMEVEKTLPRQLVQSLQQSQQEIWPSKWQDFHHHHHQQSRRKSLKQKVRLQFYF
jgi:lambda repressor-like predicted transcriptional regulator